MMKRLMLFCFLVMGIPLISLCQDMSSADIHVEFKVPKDWIRVSDTIYILKDYKIELKSWTGYLTEGHMPWRGDPKNVAVTCLWDFGITDSTPVFDFAKRLIELKKNEIYSLEVDSTNYVVYVRTNPTKPHQMRVPIAYRFEVKRSFKRGG